jgi:hypothetical protein
MVALIFFIAVRKGPIIVDFFLKSLITLVRIRYYKDIDLILTRIKNKILAVPIFNRIITNIVYYYIKLDKTLDASTRKFLRMLRAEEIAYRIAYRIDDAIANMFFTIIKFM